MRSRRTAPCHDPASPVHGRSARPATFLEREFLGGRNLIVSRSSEGLGIFWRRGPRLQVEAPDPRAGISPTTRSGREKMIRRWRFCKLWEYLLTLAYFINPGGEFVNWEPNSSLQNRNPVNKLPPKQGVGRDVEYLERSVCHRL